MKIPDWQDLRKVGNTKIMAFTIFIPVIGYMILFNEQVIHLFELSTELFPNTQSSSLKVTQISTESKSRLFYFYFGFTFLGLGSITYNVFCPKLVMQYPTDTAYINKEISIITKQNLSQLSEKLTGQSGWGSKISYTGYNPTAMEEVDLGESEIKLQIEEIKINMMRSNWQHSIHESFYWRIITSISYLLGFAILAIPTIQMFWKVAVTFFLNS